MMACPAFSPVLTCPAFSAGVKLNMVEPLTRKQAPGAMPGDGAGTVVAGFVEGRLRNVE